MGKGNETKDETEREEPRSPGNGSVSVQVRAAKQTQQKQKPSESSAADTSPASKKRSRFEERNLDSASTEAYFHYYGLIQQQQNMLQDYVRTGSYYSAIIENRNIFKDKVVIDVGAGTGILSLFAAMAGAKAVYAIEASDMANHARQLCKANLDKGGDRVHVVQCKVEEFELPGTTGKADILISEPMGTLLVNERMLESYIAARDLLLKKDGWMFPSHGRIHLAPFFDNVLHSEIMSKSQFWLQKNFYGLDLSSLFDSATSAYFEQVVVDAIPPNALLCGPVSFPIDFTKVKEEELLEIVIPLFFDAFEHPVIAHGIAAWFDVEFGSRCAGPDPQPSPEEDSQLDDSESVSHFLSTAPGSPITHWFQLRCVLKETLKILPGQKLEGEMKLKANARQSYDIKVNLTALTETFHKVGKTVEGTFNLKDPYYRQLLNHNNNN